VDERNSGEAADSIVVDGCGAGRFARRCMAIASEESGALATPAFLADAATCAIANGGTPIKPANAAAKASDCTAFFIRNVPFVG
jgi:hypothetical protein